MKLTGGYKFKRFEGAAKAVLKEVSVPETTLIQLQIAGLSFEPMLAVGDPVRAGMAVASTGGENPIKLYAPVNGTVNAISTESIIFTGDGTTQFEQLKDHTRSPWQLEKDELFKQLCSSASILLINPALNSMARCDSVTKVIVNAVHNTPLNQSWTHEIVGDPHFLANGVKILKALFVNAEITIAANKRNLQEIKSAEIMDIASIVTVSDKYPQEDPELLTRNIAQTRLVSPEGEINDSIIVIDADNCTHLAEIMTTGRPLIDKTIMIAGPGVSQPAWYRVRIGTSINLIKQETIKSDEFGPWRVILGNVMTGHSIGDDTTVQPLDTAISVIREQEFRELFRFMLPGFAWDSYPKTTVAEYLPIMPKRLDTSSHGGERPCVQCNYCDEVCPVGIYPFLIWKYVTIDKTDESFRLRPYDCIGCGLCDYVCPSKIHISGAVKQATDEYRKSRRSDEDTD